MNIWENIKLFGTSRGDSVGVVASCIPAGIKIDLEFIESMLLRRKSRTTFSTPRLENESFQIISGIYQGYTTGEPLTALFKNSNIVNENIDLKNTPRPGHADYTANILSSGFSDLRGGGYNSGRLTIGLVFLGAIAKQYLSLRDIEVLSKLNKIGYVEDVSIDSIHPDIDELLKIQNQAIPMLNPLAIEKAEALLSSTKFKGDSLSSEIECIIYNLPKGCGGYYFNSCESVISQGLFSIPAVKSISFGENPTSLVYGSKYNDHFLWNEEKVETATNHSGGILGGVSNGMPIYFKVGFKATPSISLPQQTVNLKEKKNHTLSMQGRNDVCIGLRACPVVESIVALWAMAEVNNLKT